MIMMHLLASVMSVLPALRVAIVGATVVHPARTGAAAVEPDVTVILSGDRIETVGPTATTRVPAGAEVIPARGKWLIPGLIDTHVHFFQSGNLYTRPDVADFNAVVPYLEEVARNKARLPATFKVWLASGVTSVIDDGGPLWNFEVRAQARTARAAPRVAVAGPLISLIADAALALDDPPIIKVQSVEEARALAQRELGHKPDFLKVWFIHLPGTDLAAQERIAAAVADAAHAAKIRLLVHATELETAKAALRAGADVLVHSVSDAPVDAEFLALAKKRAVIYVPTLFVMQGYALALSGSWRATPAEKRLGDPKILAAMGDLARLPEDERKRVQTRGAVIDLRVRTQAPIALANLKKVRDAGIRVALGTDAGNIGTLHGPSVFREMALMAQAGLTPREVLLSATVEGAALLDPGRDLGDVAPGKRADLVLLDADPLEDVANLARIHRVIRAGRVFDPDALVDSIR